MAAEQAGETAKDAVTATGQAALAPAVQPVLDLLGKSEGDIKAGNLNGAIDTAAKAAISTFGGGANPDAGAAGSAISGLIGPLSSLLGK